jgi:aminomethyltransferase
MSVIELVHERHGATFIERGGRRVVDSYGRPERTHRAVRNVAGVVEMATDVRTVTGSDRIAAVEDASTVDVPREDGRGAYGYLLSDGAIATDATVYNATEGDRLLVFLPPGRGSVFDRALSGAESTDVTAEMGVFGVHGASATEKIASVLSTGGGAPEPAHAFTRGTMGDEAVTVVATDAPTGEEGYVVVCDVGDAETVFDTLVNRGLNATPFGYRTFENLTLEAGTPLYESELAGREPAVFDGTGGQRLVGLTAERVPASGDRCLADGDAVGRVTRAAESPTLDRPIALAVVRSPPDAVDTDEGRVGVETVSLPFVEGSQRSGRCPGGQ